MVLLYQYNVYDMVERLLSFPREIIQAWRQYQSGRARSNWFILPIENTVVCKSGAMNSPVHIPLTAGALDWVAYGNSFQRTKHNVMSNMINNSLIYQEFPRKDNNGNTSLLTQEQQQAQHEKIKSVLNTPNINDEFIRRFFSVAPGTKLNEMKFDTSIFDTINEPLIAENTTGSLGVGLGLLTGNSGNYASLKLNIDIQMSLAHGVIEQLEADLNKVLNHHIIKNKSCYVECKYSADSYISRSQQVANNLDLYRNAKGSLEALIASIGHEPEGYLSLMENEKDLDYENRYPTHMTSFTQSNRDESISVDKTEELDIIDDPGGRPVVENPTTDKTMSTIDNDGNSTPRANI